MYVSCFQSENGQFKFMDSTIHSSISDCSITNKTGNSKLSWTLVSIETFSLYVVFELFPPSLTNSVYRKWRRVALLYTGLRDGDGSGSATFHLQHLLLQKDVDCLTRKLPATYNNVSVLQRILHKYITSFLISHMTISNLSAFNWWKNHTNELQNVCS